MSWSMSWPMSRRTRSLVLAIGAVLVLAAINISIVEKETLLHSGQSVLLELAPVDPRSLMQGDYMRLRYEATNQARAIQAELPRRGKLVVSLDANGVATFQRIYSPGDSLNDNEILLEFRRNPSSFGRDTIRLGAESFFFQEGKADLYADARYGELRVAEDGSSVLVGLRDAEREILGDRVLALDAAGVLYNATRKDQEGAR